MSNNMDALMKFYGQAMEETFGAIEYARCASASKGADADISKMYVEMATAEIGHAQRLLSCFSKKAAEHEAGWEFKTLVGYLEDEVTMKLAEAKGAVELAK